MSARTGLAILLFFLSVALNAQQAPPAMENTGKPMRVSFECGEELMQAFGLACPEEEPCEVFLDLSHFETVGIKIFITGNFHTGSATLASLLLATEDEGKTWHEPFQRIPSAGLDLIQFLDFESGWIAGQVLGAIPRNPFLLVTTDGGKTWRRRPISNDDEKVGVIEKFHFASKNDGLVLIDRVRASETGVRHELYESMTGGSSWMLRQVSDQPIEWKRPAPATNPDRRLRADQATRSFRLERREGTRWQPIASFFIKAGECKQPEPQFAEPPEQPAEEPEALEPPPVKPAKTPTLRRKPG